MSGFPDHEVITALVSGRYADPFAFLGMHITSEGLVIRALLPDASAVTLIESKTRRTIAELICEDTRGFFSILLNRRKKPFRYQLAVIWHEQTYIIEDPYRFGPLLQDRNGSSGETKRQRREG